ncbi:hypothetical protein TVAG_080430 [Trichomonas vaginalis G3]|uniref:Uncharacterized protein n=1 Tax=Trichomonas vaginalis (strain ATCC PRA-98 / G3) TaxID=412133 RepID=A2FLT4_TRIV3|nr:hypothetical protein TVAGG3_0260140 [Trichomonas vaginalis G3]EAX94137.1 hypothetical protein TVAG_080430 [Trichomonas vaginalis G3]KAI5525059.1 hypothetical protein TVAGG3_0260140 [Trichomonas vaginalis G3]|eukprot:XP_001307067.1 hypothetical protein [Trichomonas vaginalis G3]
MDAFGQKHTQDIHGNDTICLANIIHATLKLNDFKRAFTLDRRLTMKRRIQTFSTGSEHCRRVHRVWLGVMYMLFCSPLQHGRGRRRHLRYARQEK